MSYIAPAPISRPVLESEVLPTATAPVAELASRSVFVRARPALPYTDQFCRKGRMPMPDSESACALYLPLIVSAAGLDAAAQAEAAAAEVDAAVPGAVDALRANDAGADRECDRGACNDGFLVHPCSFSVVVSASAPGEGSIAARRVKAGQPCVKLGKAISTRRPPPSTLAARICPPCASIARCAMARPRPKPCARPSPLLAR